VINNRIVITDAMIAAGVDACMSLESEEAVAMVKAIYSAMERRKLIDQGQLKEKSEVA
jgi:hypothetical protein